MFYLSFSISSRSSGVKEFSLRLGVLTIVISLQKPLENIIQMSFLNS